MSGAQFTLESLIGSLPASRRDLILEVRDPSAASARAPVTGARAIHLAGETDMVFCKAEDQSLVAALLATRSRYIVARPALLPLLPDGFTSGRILIVSNKPRLLLASLLRPFDTPPAISMQRHAIHPEARISPDAIIAPGAVIGADVEIGARCVIGPNAALDHATIDEDSRVAANSTIGGDGFGYEVDEATGEVVKFPHFGRVWIGKRVEIGSSTCIDRGSLADTVLEDDVKVDNLVHIAHNCHIKRGAFVIANAMVGGSTTIGAHAWVAPSTSLLNGITLGRCAMTGMAAVVTKGVGDNEVVIGVPAHKLRDRFPEDSPLLRDRGT